MHFSTILSSRAGQRRWVQVLLRDRFTT